MLDKTRPEAATSGLGNRWAAAFGPFETKKLFRVVDERGDRYAPSCVRQRAILDGVCAQLIQNHCKREYCSRANVNVRTLNNKSAAAIVSIEGISGSFQNFCKLGARPIRL